ncbi:MAG: RNA-binding protein [Gammaproteobacteria bacterium]|nr:MAG: RNA-binding protein [Gammaproteobacteria bacterium]RKZ39135.1 MAG: RNA-binding protein [Gammaproteobacteria bacterium]RKZ73448.1 MAG: RNA-binding protein [Gammaproteobacteria bacterium]
MNIYVGNLPYSVTEDELQELFGEYGEVTTVNIITDKYSGQSKGFAFVEMTRQADAEEAIKVLNSSLMKDRNLKVNQARPRDERPRKPRGGGGRY